MQTDVSQPQPVRPPGFAARYSAPPTGYDEMIEPSGALRSHWHHFVDLIDELGQDELNRRWESARRLIHENGVTHNVYGDPAGLDRPWTLDFAPLLIKSDEWNKIEAGLVQRATLLNKLLADCYGPAEMVAEGLLPPELVYNNPGFLRPCHGIRPPKNLWLHTYSADLARNNFGEFLVLSDRTQAPSGAGYTLENRIVLSRVLPNIFRQCNVQRLAPFFVSLRKMLLELAPANRENPRIVLLTPGPYNETYFEHAYLARYLGYALVQGNDLTVRDNRVYLKTLGGLQRVDVILRRVDDDYCDPLELLPNSFLGVPGLLEAVREGNVTIANALGTGLLQTPAFLPYMPALCRRLLNEDIILGNVPTWWCGEEQSLKFVLSALHRLVIKPTFTQTGSDPVFGDQLTVQQLSELAAKIQANPSAYVAQEKLIPSTAPVILDKELTRRHCVIRTYLTASDGSYSMMAGALTRITGSGDSLSVSLQKGGGSKDTWVLADGPVAPVTLLGNQAQPVALSRGGGDLPSRVADDLFWLGRYIERAESLVRMARVTLARLIDQSGMESGSTLAILLSALSGRPSEDLTEKLEHDLLQVIFEKSRLSSLRYTVQSIHGLARVLRDRISADSWRILQEIAQDFSKFDADVTSDQLASVLALTNQMVIRFAAFSGLAMDSMTRGFAWRFLDCGRRIERATSVIRLVRSTMVKVVPQDASLLEAVLEIADCQLTYRRRYLTRLQTAALVDLLLADEGNPRSAAFQLAMIEEHLAELPRESSHPQRSPDLQLAIKLRTTLRLVDLESACKTDTATRTKLEGLLTDMLSQLDLMSKTISHTYFAHATMSRQLLAPGQETLP